ncbi:MAG: hypothetical protein Kow0037_10900 [Calditrichia bacterium]
MLFLPLVWYVWHLTPFSLVWQTVQNLSAGELLVLFGINIFTVLLFTLRWQALIRSQGYRVSFTKLYFYRLAGFGYNYFSPGIQIAGEPLQAGFLIKRENIPAAFATATLMADKILEFGSKSVFLGIGVLFLINLNLLKSDLSPLTILLTIGLLALPFLTLGAYLRGKRPVTGLIKICLAGLKGRKRFSCIKSFVEQSEAELIRLAQKGRKFLIGGFVFSLAGWLLFLLEFWLSLKFLNVNFYWSQGIALFTGSKMAFLIPVPAGMGALDAIMAWLFKIMGKPVATGLAVVLLIRVRDVLFGVLGIIAGGFILTGNGKTRTVNKPRPDKRKI